nr:putative ribonuclease H-like domain-containing protein [Tanacetum cinerariifolium]
QRSNKNKEGLRYSAVPSSPAQIYSPLKKDLSWTGLPEFVDDTVTEYHRPTPSIDASKCNKSELQSSNFSVFEHGESTGSIRSKPMIKFVKEDDCHRVIKINNTENARKSTVKYAEMYRNISKGYWDSGCSRHMTGNTFYLSDYEPYDGGYVSFGHGGGKITGKGITKTDFKLNNDTNVLLRTPRQHNMYSIDLNNIVPYKNLTCLVAKASVDEKMNELCTKKGIRREFSNARTPQQNGVAERRNRTLIEDARTMLADAKLPWLNKNKLDV